jgi:mono/diheme cytochrome c family protein
VNGPAEVMAATCQPHLSPPTSRASSSVIVGGEAACRVVLVADADAHAVIVVASASREWLSAASLPASPSQLLPLPDGRLAVTLPSRNHVVVMRWAGEQSDRLVIERELEVDADPQAMATTPDGSSLLVTSGWGRSLQAFALPDLRLRFRVPLHREPRAVVVDDKGELALVSHSIGATISRIDLRADAPKVKALPVLVPSRRERVSTYKHGTRFSGCSRVLVGGQGYALASSPALPGRVFAPMSLTDPGDPRGSPGTAYGNCEPSSMSTVVVIDERAGRLFSESLATGQGAWVESEACRLPRAAAIDPATHLLYVTCLGSNKVVAYDAEWPAPRAFAAGAWDVASGPTGVAIDELARLGVVWSQLDQTLTWLSLDEPGSPAAELHLASRTPSKLTVDQTRGRALFYTAGEPISDGPRACADCHPEGRDDGLTWVTPEGPRNTPMLAGRLHGTAPYGWSGGNAGPIEALTSTLGRLHGKSKPVSVDVTAAATDAGATVPPPAPALSEQDTRAIFAYLASLAPVAPSVLRPPEDVARIARGRAIFSSTEAACSECHSPSSAYTDRARHDVKSQSSQQKTTLFDTPSLVNLRGTAPYYHDGRYDTVHAMLVGTDGDMGHTRHLTPSDLDALEAFLESL